MDTGIIASCEHTLKLYRACGVSARRLSLIYYGPDESKFDPANLRRGLVRQEFGWPADAPLIGMVAIFYTEFGSNRWTPPVLHGRAGKGHEELIRAAPIVLREFPKAKFLLVGPAWHAGGEKFLARMQALVAELGLKDSVVFTGFRSDVPQIYRDLNVSVQASLNENLGGTIESLLMQCPTVATRVGGLTDSVIDDVTGILVSPADPVDLARGILRLLRDRKRARAQAEAGRARMLARFTLSKTIADLHAPRAVIRVRNAWCGLRAMPRMLAYRGYGAAARGARALGLRRSRPVGTHAGNWASSPAGLNLCLTRGSISFERTLCEEDGFAGSSPAMTNGEVDANGKCSSISAARIVAMPKSLVIPTHCL
jgi:hypothetical protein